MLFGSSRVRGSDLPTLKSINTLTNQSVISWSELEFTFDEENGVIIDKATGERCLIFARARLENIFLRLTDLFQSGAQVIIAEAFKAAGKWYVNEIPEGPRTDKAEFLKAAVQRFMDSGLGRVEIVEFNPETLEVQVRIWNNLFAEMYHDDATYCNCVEAYVSGVYEQFTGKTPKARKTRCIGKNDPYCEWYFSLPPPVE
jgi:predicted hydrocarbon binding protein